MNYQDLINTSKDLRYIYIRNNGKFHFILTTFTLNQEKDFACYTFPFLSGYVLMKKGLAPMWYKTQFEPECGIYANETVNDVIGYSILLNDDYKSSPYSILDQFGFITSFKRSQKTMNIGKATYSSHELKSYELNLKIGFKDLYQTLDTI